MADDALRALVGELRSFETRSRAMRGLVWAGKDAVPALSEALSDRQGSVRWAAGKCLADIGDAQAAGPLIQRLDHDEDRTWAMEFLARLTGEGLPADPGAWKSWWQARQKSEAGSPSGPPHEEWEDEDLLKEAASGLEAKIRSGDGVFSLTLPVRKERHQEVMVLTRQKDSDGSPLVIVYSACGPAAADNFEWALRMNLTLPYGSIAVRDLEGNPAFVMFNTLLRVALTPLELRKSIVTVAAKSDEIEETLTHQDRY